MCPESAEEGGIVWQTARPRRGVLILSRSLGCGYLRSLAKFGNLCVLLVAYLLVRLDGRFDIASGWQINLALVLIDCRPPLLRAAFYDFLIRFSCPLTRCAHSVQLPS